MLKERKAAAEKVAKAIHDLEQKLEEVFTAAVAVPSTMSEARGAAGLSKILGHDAEGEFFSVIQAIMTAKQHAASGHVILGTKTRKEAGLGATALYGEQWCPESNARIATPDLAIVSAAA